MLVRFLLNISKLEREPTQMAMFFSLWLTERSAEAKKESMSICKNILVACSHARLLFKKA
jgi:hypothetical protein